ncbi:MAG: FAD binding domain-containing protein [Dehalococcoidia bacterium]
MCIALDGEMVLRGIGGERVVTAKELFITYFTTAIAPTELLTQVRFPAWVVGRGWGFEEVTAATATSPWSGPSPSWTWTLT